MVPELPAESSATQEAASRAAQADHTLHFASKLATLATGTQRRTPLLATSLLRAGVLLAALAALLLHDATTLRFLPPRGSAGWTALAAACVALPFARALPTTPRRRPKWASRTQQADRRFSRRAAAARFGAAVSADAAAVCDEAEGDRDEVARILAARDHFDVLQLSRDADSAAARRAYRAAALRVHPDKANADGASAAWERVQQAGAVLTEDDARDAYAAALARSEGRSGSRSGAGRVRRRAAGSWRAR